MMAFAAVGIHEAELARWLFTTQPSAGLIASELCFALKSSLAFGVAPSCLGGMATGPGDIDVLVLDRASPERAIAIEVKRVKLPAEAYATSKPNKLQAIDKAYRQVGLLRKMGFHRSYLVVAVIADGREQTGVSFPFRGPPPAVVNLVREKLTSLEFHPDVGVVVVELTQSVDKNIHDSGSVGIWTHQPSRSIEQDLDLTKGLRAFLHAAQARPMSGSGCTTPSRDA